MKEQAQQLIKALRQYSSILVFIKGSPDPDAIASSLAIKCICESLDIRATICAAKKISLPQNKVFIRKLDIPVRIIDDAENMRKHDAYAVVDHQSASVEKVTGVIPCVLHIDHHEKVKDEVAADFRLIRQDMGSTSTIISLLMKEMDLQFKDSIRRTIATSLLFGIQTDTDKYSHASPFDYEAINYLSQFADSSVINSITGLPMSQTTARYLSLAAEKQVIYKNWLICGLGFIDESDRDSIAIIADFLLSREKASVVVVFAAVTGKNKKVLTLDASFRTNSDTLNLNSIIKAITPNGGARKYKGAFQVQLDFLHTCPDRGLLWEVIRLSTMEALKQSRDEILITGLRGFFSRFSDKISDMFN